MRSCWLRPRVLSGRRGPVGVHERSSSPRRSRLLSSRSRSDSRPRVSAQVAAISSASGSPASRAQMSATVATAPGRQLERRTEAANAVGEQPHHCGQLGPLGPDPRLQDPAAVLGAAPARRPPQAAATGHDHADPRAAAQRGLHQEPSLGEDLLAVVEHQQARGTPGYSSTASRAWPAGAPSPSAAAAAVSTCPSAAASTSDRGDRQLEPLAEQPQRFGHQPHWPADPLPTRRRRSVDHSP
jgi:hypothetical protein